jgi:hypothetical protein
MKCLIPIDDPRCPLCGRGMKVTKPKGEERELYSFKYDCKCGYIMPVLRMDEQGNYVYGGNDGYR